MNVIFELLILRIHFSVPRSEMSEMIGCVHDLLISAVGEMLPSYDFKFRDVHN